MRCFAARVNGRLSPLGNVGARGRKPSQICAEAPAAKRRGVRQASSRGCAEGTLARPQRGIPKGAQPSLASLCLLSAGQKVEAPARPAKCPEGVSASKGKIKSLIGVKGINKVSPRKAPGQQTPKRTLSASREKSHFVEAWREENKKFPPSPFDKFVHAGVVCLETSRGCVSC